MISIHKTVLLSLENSHTLHRNTDGDKQPPSRFTSFLTWGVAVLSLPCWLKHVSLLPYRSGEHSEQLEWRALMGIFWVSVAYYKKKHFICYLCVNLCNMVSASYLTTWKILHQNCLITLSKLTELLFFSNSFKSTLILEYKVFILL